MGEAEKLFIKAEEFNNDSFKLARKIWDDGFKPDFLIGVWRGGTVPGMIIHEFFKYKGKKVDHIAVRTGRYHGIDEKKESVEIYGLGYVIDNLGADDKLLIVDDVFDEGRTVQALLNEIRRRSRRNTPIDIRVATVYYKSNRNKTDIKPDYFVHDTDSWIIFPHELEGLTLEEIEKKNSEIASFVKG